MLARALESIETTPQRRVLLRVPWRFPTMNGFARLAVAAVAAIAIGAVGLAVLRPGVGPASPGPTPSATPSPTMTAQPSDLLSRFTESHTSTTEGFSISYPKGWIVRPASEPWTAGIPRGDSTTADNLNPGNNNLFLAVASQPLGDKTFDQWAAELSTHTDWGDTCPPTIEPVTIDGTVGLLAIHCPDDGVQSAFVAVENRGYMFVAYRLPDLTYFKTILGTVQLHPEDAVTASPAVSP
ncbi:MAG TPA: hypothetical protein VEX41_06805 [Candidatus Eisenbacteria bacterium]|nr:hypothetical protein [Candidatus Eisenbacteria bacterium]